MNPIVIHWLALSVEFPWLLLMVSEPTYAHDHMGSRALLLGVTVISEHKLIVAFDEKGMGCCNDHTHALCRISKVYMGILGEQVRIMNTVVIS